MKSREEIYQALCEDFQQRSGQPLIAESDTAIRLWATAAALESLYYYTDWSRQQCFPQTASGKYLDYHGTMRDLTRKSAACAVGKVTFSLNAAKDTDVMIPAGTVVATQTQLLFQTVCDGKIAAGSKSVQLDAVCCTAGEQGNVVAGTVTVLTDAPVGVSSCSNPQPFHGGADTEEDECFRERILQTYRHLSTGANEAFYYRQAIQTQGVAKCKVVARSAGVGTVKVLLVGDSEDETVRSAVEQRLNAEREISTDITVEFAEAVPYSLQVTIWPKSEYSFTQAEQAVKAAAAQYLRDIPIGKSVYLTQLGAQLMNCGAIENYALAAGSTDLTVGEEQYPVLTLNVTEGA